MSSRCDGLVWFFHEHELFQLAQLIPNAQRTGWWCKSCCPVIVDCSAGILAGDGSESLFFSAENGVISSPVLDDNSPNSQKDLD